jgi:hypothetical protein
MYKYKHFLFILNLLLKPLNLQWAPTLGLTYKYNLFFGEIGIVITKDLKQVLEFLRMDPLYLSDKQYYTISEFLYIIKDSRYIYLPSIFTKPTYLPEDIEELHKNLVNLIKLTIQGNIKNSIKIQSNFIPFKDKDRMIHLLDNAFNQNGTLYKKIKLYDKSIDKMRKVFIKNKFNGKLIMQWVPSLTPGKYLADIISAFKTYIEIEEKEIFNMYVKRININELRLSFVYWYNKEIIKLDNDFSDLPF